jgi:hypothetical protein
VGREKRCSREEEIREERKRKRKGKEESKGRDRGLGRKEREGYQPLRNKNPACGLRGPHSFYRTGPHFCLSGPGDKLKKTVCAPYKVRNLIEFGNLLRDILRQSH